MLAVVVETKTKIEIDEPSSRGSHWERRRACVCFVLNLCTYRKFSAHGG